MAAYSGSSGTRDFSDEFIELVPKAELHAHLSGSVSEKSLEEVFEVKRNQLARADYKIVDNWLGNLKQNKKDLKWCFDTFKIIQTLCNDCQTVTKVAEDVIKEFLSENVKYLELRSTPRAIKASGMTKKSYIDAVLLAIDNCSDLDIDVRLIVSIDRRCTIDEAYDTVELLAQYQKQSDRLVGLDFSGDPTVGDARKFLPVLQHSRDIGQKITMHIAEVSGKNDEIQHLLEFIPDRIGHGTFLLPDVGGQQTFVDLIRKQSIPLELCLSSNVVGGTVPSYATHHFKYWTDVNHPIALCTDDKGVFSTTLTQEYYIAKREFSLTNSDIWSISRRALDFAFISENRKTQLEKIWLNFAIDNGIEIHN